MNDSVRNTKLFKDRDMNVVFGTQKTIHNIPRSHPNTNKQNRSSIHEMKCLDCEVNTQNKHAESLTPDTKEKKTYTSNKK
jgi:hypothetical protein